MIPSLVFTPEDDPGRLGLDSPARLDQLFRLLYGRPPREPSRQAQELAARLRQPSSTVFRCLGSTDGTVKLGMRFPGARPVESVVLQDRRPDGQPRRTACLSTQIGCAASCTFCMTGTMGLQGNLTAGEILEQYLQLRRRFGEISNLVFMGMGEPLHNLPAVLQAIRVLTHPHGPAIPFSRLTLSTAGVLEGIETLAETEDFSPRLPGRPRLAVSLVSARPERRWKLMPLSRQYGSNPAAALAALRESLRSYQARTDQRLTLELVLIGGETDTPEDARAIVDFLRGGASELLCDINLIRWNPVAGLPFREPEEAAIDRFAGILVEEGLSVTFRFPRGRRLEAGCGQLGSSVALMRRTP